MIPICGVKLYAIVLACHAILNDHNLDIIIIMHGKRSVQSHRSILCRFMIIITRGLFSIVEHDQT